MVKPASIPRISGSLACLALLLGSATAQAQQAPKPASSKDTPSEEAIFIPIEYRPPPYQVSVGVRISGKAKVKFSGLGNILPAMGADSTDPKLLRKYDNGYVGPDNSWDFTTGKPVVNPDKKTNYWGFSSANQLSPSDFPNAQTVAMQSHHIATDGATLTAENGQSPAWDIEISRQLGGNKKLSWGVVFGGSINAVNVKTSGTVKANLKALTDLYSLDGEGKNVLLTTTNPDLTTVYNSYYYGNGAAGPQPVPVFHQDTNADGSPKFSEDAQTHIITPVMVATLGPDGVTQLQNYPDNSVRIPGLPVSRTDPTTGLVDITGIWQVKGAYMTARLGPYMALQLGRHFAIRASAGLTLTILGANFKFDETYLTPSAIGYLNADTANTPKDATVTTTTGYFASGELEWFLTQRTGFFVGAAYENYTRNLRITLPETTQTADLSVSTGAVLRTGVTTRF